MQSKGPSDNFRALVRFSLPAVPAGCTLQAATLRLFAASAGSGRTLQASRLAASWIRALALARPDVLPSTICTVSAPRIETFAAQWLAYALPCQRFAEALTGNCA